MGHFRSFKVLPESESLSQFYGVSKEALSQLSQFQAEILPARLSRAFAHALSHALVVFAARFGSYLRSKSW